MACFIVNQNDNEARNRGVCAPRLEDYYECLHHRKEVPSLARPQRAG
jgi:NADH dehydrogenase (ubiquinone) Fe-S protein 5